MVNLDLGKVSFTKAIGILLRHGGSLLGGFLIAKGVEVEDATTLAGAVVSLLSVAASYVEKKARSK